MNFIFFLNHVLVSLLFWDDQWVTLTTNSCSMSVCRLMKSLNSFFFFSYLCTSQLIIRKSGQIKTYFCKVVVVGVLPIFKVYTLVKSDPTSPSPSRIIRRQGIRGRRGSVFQNKYLKIFNIKYIDNEV